MGTKEIEEYLTPYKYNQPVLTGSGIPGTFNEQAVDIPFVFYHNNQFYMLYTGYNGERYQSALAKSTNLIEWEHVGVILESTLEERWDKVGGAATWIIKESDNLYDLPRPRKIQGKYWLVYHSYPFEGYEQGPAEIGLAWSEDEDLLTWHRLEQPVFSWKDGGAWERGGLYKACIISNEDTWYMFYNAKNAEDRWIEQTGVATSRDLINWERSSENPVLKISEGRWDERFVSDPYILKDKDKWLNFYFGYGGGHAQEGLAISKDLVLWEKVEDPIITHGVPGSLDARHAHKASIVYYQGILYHFYCGTRPYQQGDPTKMGDEFRAILLATSQPLRDK